jgi:hypothetical protein
MAALSEPGALTRATSHAQMPAAVAVAVAIGGEAARVTRAPSKGPLVTAPENPMQCSSILGSSILGSSTRGTSARAIQDRRPDRGRRVHHRLRLGGRGHVAIREHHRPYA